MLRKCCWVWCMRVMITALVVAASHSTAARAYSLPSSSTLSSPSSAPQSPRSGDPARPGSQSLGSSSSHPKSSDIKPPKKEVGNQARLNVVEENPNLDVGPLVVVRVASGSIARLPCDTRPLYANDSVTLVLWYSDDTSRPFLSFDGRSDFAGKELRSKSDTSFKEDSNSRSPYKNTSYDLPASKLHRNSVNNKRPDPDTKHNRPIRKTRSARNRVLIVPNSASSTYKRRRLKNSDIILAYSYNGFGNFPRSFKKEKREIDAVSFSSVEKPSSGEKIYKYNNEENLFNNSRSNIKIMTDFDESEQISWNVRPINKYHFFDGNMKMIYENENSFIDDGFKSFDGRRTRRSVTSSNQTPVRKVNRRKGYELFDEPVTFTRSSRSRPFPPSASRQHSFLTQDSSSTDPQSTPAPPPYSSYLPYASVRGLGAPPNRVSRVTLARSGATLLIRDVEKKDQAEYRCTVHYRKSPSVTHRLRLEVQKRVRGMLLLDESGMVAGRETGPHSEGHRLTVTCRAAFEGKLRSLEWMMDGKLLPSSWSLPRPKEVVSHLELKLVPEYDQKFLTCRVVTHADEDGGGKGGKGGPEGPGTGDVSSGGDNSVATTGDNDTDGGVGGGNDTRVNEVGIGNNGGGDENNVGDRIRENDRFAGVSEVPKLVKGTKSESELSNNVRFVTRKGERFLRSVGDLGSFSIRTNRKNIIPATTSRNTDLFSRLYSVRRQLKQGTEAIEIDKSFQQSFDDSSTGRKFDTNLPPVTIAVTQASNKNIMLNLERLKNHSIPITLANSHFVLINSLSGKQPRPIRRLTDQKGIHTPFSNSTAKRLGNYPKHSNPSPVFEFNNHHARRVRRADTLVQRQQNNFIRLEEQTLESNDLDTLSNYRDNSRKSQEFSSSPGAGSSLATGPKFRKHRLKSSMRWEATITDISVRINMFSIPQSRLGVVEGEGVVGLQGGVSVEVAEGGQVTLECRVTANPPPYNITFMLNGQVVSSPRLDQHLNYDGVEFFEEKSSRREQMIQSEHINKKHKSHAPKWIELSKNHRKNKYSANEAIAASSKNEDDGTNRYRRASGQEEDQLLPLYSLSRLSFIKSTQGKHARKIHHIDELLKGESESILQYSELKTQKETSKFPTPEENDIQMPGNNRKIRRVSDYSESINKITEEGRRRKGGASLLVSPVVRAAEGLYTCLASNTEGDGHSNAIMLRVRHAPYCQSPPLRRSIVSRNSSITLFCPVEANPKVTSYTWIKVSPGSSVEDPRPKYEYLGRSLGSGSSLRVTPNMFQAFENEGSQEESVSGPLGWQDDNLGLDGELKNRRKRELRFHGIGQGRKRLCSPGKKKVKHASKKLDNFLEQGPQHNFPDESKVRRSVASDAVGIVCYAKNSQGYSVRPCLFSMQLVDPPPPPANCSVTVISSTRLAVHCLEPSPLPSTLTPTPQPGLGYVRSPHTRTLTTLEVWSSTGLLLINVSSVHPSFDVRGLPPASPLQLRLYASSPERLISMPVKLLASTPKWTVKETVIEEPPAAPAYGGVLPNSPSSVPQDHHDNSQSSASMPQKPQSPQSHAPDTSTSADQSDSSVNMLRVAAVLGATALGGCVIVSVLVTLLSIVMKYRRRRRRPSNLDQTSPSSSRTGSELRGSDRRRRRSGMTHKYMRNENAVMMMSMEDDDADEERTPDDDRFDDRECGTTLSDDEYENDDRNSEEHYLDMNRSEQEQPLFSDDPLSDRGSNQDLLRTPVFSFNPLHPSRNDSPGGDSDDRGMYTRAMGGNSLRSGNPSLEIVCKDDILRVVDNTFADAEGFYCPQATPNQSDVFHDVDDGGYRRGSDQWSSSPSVAPPLHKMVTFLVPSDDVTSHEDSDGPHETHVML